MKIHSHKQLGVPASFEKKIEKRLALERRKKREQAEAEQRLHNVGQNLLWMAEMSGK